jgi:hypothetical protein
VSLDGTELAGAISNGIAISKLSVHVKKKKTGEKGKKEKIKKRGQRMMMKEGLCGGRSFAGLC